MKEKIRKGMHWGWGIAICRFVSSILGQLAVGFATRYDGDRMYEVYVILLAVTTVLMTLLWILLTRNRYNESSLWNGYTVFALCTILPGLQIYHTFREATEASNHYILRGYSYNVRGSVYFVCALAAIVLNLVVYYYMVNIKYKKTESDA